MTTGRCLGSIVLGFYRHDRPLPARVLESIRRSVRAIGVSGRRIALAINRHAAASADAWRAPEWKLICAPVASAPANLTDVRVGESVLTELTDVRSENMRILLFFQR